MLRTGIAIATLLISSAAHAADCRAITDSLERLRCYDAQNSPAGTPSVAPILQLPSVASKPPAPAEDPLIAKAKAAVRKQLRQPESARWEGVQVKTAEGKKGVCGMVNAKNGAGGMSGANFFVYDGERATILVTGGPSTNPTSFGPDILALTLHNGIKAHDLFCK